MEKNIVSVALFSLFSYYFFLPDAPHLLKEILKHLEGVFENQSVFGEQWIGSL